MRHASWIVWIWLPAAAIAAPSRNDVTVATSATSPVIDGQIEPESWGLPVQTDAWVSYDPLRGEPMKQQTQVWVTHDSRFLYFAFRCLDENASGVRSTTARRDTVWNDDWVGLSLDSQGAGQSSYHLMSNPAGIQMDALNTVSAGERWDVDFVWDSVGKRTAEGYDVEMRIPLTSIRFNGGPNVQMGILFWRRISRLGVSSSWPAIPTGQWVFNAHARLNFAELHPPKLLELIPSATHSLSQVRNRGSWDDAVNQGDLGISAKYGLTSSITLDATINPDFSQVESDSFQVEVNQRFPLFFSEKRPFFMEGGGLFNIAGSGDGDGNLRTAVHTRRIADPAGGVKFTGSAGRVTFGTLSALDQAPARSSLTSGKNQWFNIGRLMYGFGQANYAGALFTDTEIAGRHNRVGALDFQIRPSRSQSLGVSVLHSRTGLKGARDRAGSAAQATYFLDTQRYTVGGQIEHWDESFQMDTAFMNRTGITTGWLYTAMNFYPGRDGPFGWIKRISPFVWQRHGKDHTHHGIERYVLPSIRVNFTRQGQFRIDHGWGRDPWLGREYRADATRIQGGAQWNRWLNTWSEVRWSQTPFFDDVRPFQGKQRSANLRITLQPTGKLNQNISYNNVRFERASTGERVFSVHVVNLKTTYLFNRRTSVRAIEQWDSSRRRVLLDFLGAYELGPGTVLYAGYGSLLEAQASENYHSTRRGLFLKASYLKRF